MQLRDNLDTVSELDLQLAPNSWVFPRHKIVWLAIAKNACTSLKWMFADLTGEDSRKFNRSQRAEVTRRMCVHDRSLWSHVRRPEDLTEADRAAIHPDNGWFIFSVVRDPRVRIWSAWQSKFLQRDPIYMRLFKDAEWLPRLPHSSQDVIEDFATFVHWAATHPQDKIHKDPHFASQASRLDRQTVPFTKIYDISELSSMVRDLQGHLEAVQASGILSLGRDNDTSLPVRGELFAAPVRQELEAICREDLARFGDRWDFEETIKRDPAWPTDAFQTIAIRSAMGERIRDLVDLSWDRKREIRKKDDELKRLRARTKKLESDLGALRHAPTGAKIGAHRELARGSSRSHIPRTIEDASALTKGIMRKFRGR